LVAYARAYYKACGFYRYRIRTYGSNLAQ